MTEEAGLKLLAAIEALHAEVRGMREEARDERNATKTLHDQRARKAARQREWRVRNVSVDATRNVSVASTPQVVKEEAKKKDQDQKQLPVARRHKDVTAIGPKQTGPVWQAYSAAFHERYTVPPVRNSKGNALICQLVKRLGDDSAAVAGFYLKHNAAHYSGNGHPLTLLIRDCEKLQMEWQRGKQLTRTEAHQKDQTQANMDGWLEHMSPEGRDALVGK